MKPTFVDYETFFSDEYSLRKMTPIEYILDPRFEVIGCAIQEGIAGTPYWVEGPDLDNWFAHRDPSELWLVSHNALFDACITAWRYGVVPRLTSCTLSTSRALIGHEVKSVSLATVTAHLNLRHKIEMPLKVKGMGLAALKAQPVLYEQFQNYALRDCEGCVDIFQTLVVSGKLPAEELAVQDMVFRCTLQPQFKLNPDALAQHLQMVQAAKEHLLARSMLVGAQGKSCLTGDEQFAELLRGLGVEPPMKRSLKTGKMRYAFAKTDTEFLDLQEHTNAGVQALVAARLGHKTTLEETRTKRLLTISQLNLQGKQGMMPMPLRISGAHTHRLSGDWALNVQNLPRGGKLRDALEAPDDNHMVITADSSQIEARLTAWLCGQQDLVNQFASGEDVYSNFARELFGIPFDVPVDKKGPQRFVAKQAILGLGFGLGWVNFQKRVKIDSKNQTGTAIELSDGDAIRIVEVYRSKFFRIPATWRLYNTDVIPVIAYGGERKVGPCLAMKNKVLLPSLTSEGYGLALHYKDLHKDEAGEWWFNYAGKPKKLYGGKFLENIVQALDRVIVIGAALRIQKRIYPYRLAQQAHDENGYVVHKQHENAVRAILEEEMLRRPSWAPDLPLATEIGAGKSYGEAK